MRARPALLSAVLMTLSPPALAAMPPATYYAKAEGNTVTICPQLLNKRGCPQPEGMLRQDAATGKVVRLPQKCTDKEVLPPGVNRGGTGGACYVDECVPPGTYRYGYARPLKCMGSGSRYYFEVKVTRPLPPDCARTSKPPTPHPRAPWSDSPWVCVRSGCGCASAGGQEAAGLVAALLLLAAGLLLRRARRARGLKRAP